MADARVLRIFYHRQLLERARAGGHNYTNRIDAALRSRGWRVELCLDSDAARVASLARPGRSLFHMAPPLGARSLTTRLAYWYPFWRIEASAKRWEWDVAQARFDPEAVDPEAAARFRTWRRGQHLKGVQATGDAVFVPLQGRLQEARSFQTMSPLAMLEQTLAHTGPRRVVATLHPNETYLTAERAALDDLAARHPRLQVSDAPADRVLGESGLVVTQNSSVALLAYLLDLPVILFGQIDFHHIALNVAELGVAGAFARAADHRPDCARYLFWFFRMNAIDAAAEDAEAQILRRFADHGWTF
ncbi:hypothetical protein [Palleronia pelagia]|uniref:Capsule polysaccharide biosynthesis protein n=1 Tax=Palleronia pelagia TaxID=387096 RepID=A0A1H8F742_9RHOB|nr:hypothetical protein [Palleronia pelagia]SEN26848.1 hypothetical protein SAMN04488011_103217 [Palleronia pelagia]